MKPVTEDRTGDRERRQLPLTDASSFTGSGFTMFSLFKADVTLGGSDF